MGARPDGPDAAPVALPGGFWQRVDGGAGQQPQRQLALRPVAPEDQISLLDRAAGTPLSIRATALLARCLDDPETVHALTVGDRDALLLHLRRLTVGETVNCLLRCPIERCGQEMDLSFAVGDLLVPPYPDSRPSYVLDIDDTGHHYQVRYRLPTAGDLDAVAALAVGDPSAAAAEIFRRCVLAAACDGASIAAAELPEPARDATAAAMADRDPQAEIELEATCPVCGSVFSAAFDAAAFLLGELEQHAAQLLIQVHILASRYHWSEADILAMPSGRRDRYLDLISRTAEPAGAL